MTQQNAGRATAGIDGQVALTSRDRAELADRLQRRRAWQALPVKRVYIPKGKTNSGRWGYLPSPIAPSKNRVRNTLEPQWEATLRSPVVWLPAGQGSDLRRGPLTSGNCA